MKFEINKILNNFLLARDKFESELQLRQNVFIYSTCGSFTKYHERIKKFRETGELGHLYRNELDKACFVHDVAYSDS